MKHPNPERCRELGTLFLMIDEEPSEKRVNMMNGSWPNETLDTIGECGTVSCHAGWLAWGMGADTNATNGKGFMHYAHILAEFVGKDSANDLTVWAATNTGLWGNENGGGMFHDSYAFSNRTENEPWRATTLKEIGIHWLKVADRIEAHEKNL